MQLLDIEDPYKKETEHNFEYTIGIDLGTTNTVCAYCHDDAIKLIKFNNDSTMPSIVSFVNGEVIVGRMGPKNDSINFESIKRLMGKGIEDLGDDYERYKGLIDHIKDNRHIINLYLDKNHTITPIEISAHIIERIKQSAIEQLELKDIQKCVITVPAYFDDAARNATAQAAKIAGLEVLRLINEPTAAAIAYGLDNKSEGFYGIYDLGGGTFDVSIIEMKQGVFRVISTRGDNQLGGNDFDFKIADFFIENYFEGASFEDLNHNEISKLLRFARSAKEYLTDNQIFTNHFHFRNKDYQISIQRTEFEAIINNLVDESITLFEKALKSAKLTVQDLEDIILVGGATRVPLVSRKIQEKINKKPLDGIDPDLIVSYGAAIQANNLCNGSNNLLIDVTPLSVGIETMGGIIEKIIPRNSPIPISITQEFTSYQDKQNAIKIHVLQGERELVNQNRSLAQFELTDLPAKKAGSIRVAVTFNIDRDGILTVTAIEKTTNKKQHIEIKPTYGLNIKEIEQILRTSYEHAKQDMILREI